MPYGFFITDKGRELLVEAGKTESKVEITKACFGSGGDPNANRNYGITELVNQFYEKKLSPDTDSYEISSVDPTQLCIHTVVPNEISGRINEIGYKDDEDNLIIYGIVRERFKDTGTLAEAYQFEYTNWLKLENLDIDKIEIVTSSIEYDKFNEVAEDVLANLAEMNTTVNNFISTTNETVGSLRTDVNLKVNKEDGKRLLENTEGNQIAANKTNISSLQTKVSSLEANLDKKVDKVTGKDLVSTSDYNSLKSRVSSLESTLNNLKTVLEKYL